MKNLFCFIFIVLISCDSKTKTNHFQFKKVEEFSFKANDLSATNPGMVQLIESDSGDFIFLYNHVIKQLQISEFPSGKLMLNIPLDFEEEKRIKRFTGGTLISKDSVWVTFFPPAIGLINFRGDLIFTENFPQGKFEVSHVGNGSTNPLFQSFGKIYGAQPFLMDHHRMEKEDIQKQQLTYSYDPLTKTFEWYDVFYNENYWDQGKKLSYYSSAMRDGRIYLAPYYDHEIQIFDTGTNTVVLKKQVISKSVNKFNIVNELPNSGEEAIINTLESDQYETFLYDQYRDVFYRIFLPGFKIDQDYTIEKLRLLERSRPFTGILVLDKDLNILHEHVFDKFEIHSSDNFLVGKKGLYVSSNNMNREDFSDDYFKYQLIAFDENEN